jgi:hypothetical protein
MHRRTKVKNTHTFARGTFCCFDRPKSKRFIEFLSVPKGFYVLGTVFGSGSVSQSEWSQVKTGKGL